MMSKSPIDAKGSPLIEKHVLYVVNRPASSGLRVDGGAEIDSVRRPDGSLTIGDTIYHVHLKAVSYKTLDAKTRREALKSVTEQLQAAHNNAR